jgi:hypothetical protein
MSPVRTDVAFHELQAGLTENDPPVVDLDLLAASMS